MPVVSVRDLSKSYGDHPAVVSVSFDIEAGETVAVIGPNGAGKTTTVEILEGFRSRSGGQLQVLGTDPEHAGADWRAQIGMVLQSTSLDSDLTVAETIGLYAGLYPNPKSVEESLALVGLAAEAKTRVGQLSGGQQRRVDLAVGMVGNPRLLFLDEPTTGLDPEAREHAWTAVGDLTAHGTTVLLTTHYLEEARQLADRIIVLADGRVLANDRPDRITRLLESETRITFRIDDPTRFGTLPPALADTATLHRDAVTLHTADPRASLAELLAWSDRVGESITGLTVSPASLESVYLKIVSGAYGGSARND
jgi:ABC-2 type transport system ATP-binding protein